MDRDLDTPFFLMRALGPMLGIVSVMIMAMVVAPVILYVIARWRAHRDPQVDPQLGLKFALHYFAISAFQLGLAGLALFLYTLISPGPSEAKGSGYRVAFGLLVPAALVLAMHLRLLARTNDEQVPSVRRLFVGYNLLVTGLLGFVALIFGFQALFAKGPTGGMGHASGAMVLVYGSAWGVLGWKLGQIVLGHSGFGTGSSGGSGLPASTAPTQPAPVPHGLPALGGGSFPPIETETR